MLRWQTYESIMQYWPMVKLFDIDFWIFHKDHVPHMRRAFTFLRSVKLVSITQPGKKCVNTSIVRSVSQNISSPNKARVENQTALDHTSGTYWCFFVGAFVLLVALFLNVDAIAGFVEIFVVTFSIWAFLLLSADGKIVAWICGNLLLNWINLLSSWASNRHHKSTDDSITFIVISRLFN